MTTTTKTSFDSTYRLAESDGSAWVKFRALVQADTRFRRIQQEIINRKLNRPMTRQMYAYWKLRV